MSLGSDAEYIGVVRRFLVECDERGWWSAYCTDCSAKGSSPERDILDQWVYVHGQKCPGPDPEYKD